MSAWYMVKLVVKFPSNPPTSEVHVASHITRFGRSLSNHLGNTSCEVRSLLQDIDLLRNLLNQLSLLQFNLLLLRYNISTLRTDCSKVYLNTHLIGFTERERIGSTRSAKLNK